MNCTEAREAYLDKAYSIADVIHERLHDDIASLETGFDRKIQEAMSSYQGSYYAAMNQFLRWVHKGEAIIIQERNDELYLTSYIQDNRERSARMRITQKAFDQVNELDNSDESKQKISDALQKTYASLKKRFVSDERVKKLSPETQDFLISRMDAEFHHAENSISPASIYGLWYIPDLAIHRTSAHHQEAVALRNFMKTNPLREEMIVYRAVRSKHIGINDDAVGTVIQFPQFTSTTLNPFVAKTFFEGQYESSGTGGYDYLAVIRLKEKTPAIPMRQNSYYNKESEVLVHDEVQYRITGADKKKHIIYLETV